MELPVRALPPGLYSVTEAAVFSGLTARHIRNELDRGIVRPRRFRRGNISAVALPEGALAYFRLMRDVPIKFSRSDRRDLYLLMAEGRARGAWRRNNGALCKGPVAVSAGPVAASVARALRAYRRGLGRIESRADILGGDPVFTGTRILVRHIGGMAVAGESAAAIARDYPGLSAADIEFARLFARLHPYRGRPRRLRLEFVGG